jgi:hypothetical protein
LEWTQTKSKIKHKLQQPKQIYLPAVCLKAKKKSMGVSVYALFVWLISHQPAAVLFSQNKAAITNQPAVHFSQNKPAPAIKPPAQRTGCQLPLMLGLAAR